MSIFIVFYKIDIYGNDEKYCVSFIRWKVKNLCRIDCINVYFKFIRSKDVFLLCFSLLSIYQYLRIFYFLLLENVFLDCYSYLIRLFKLILKVYKYSVKFFFDMLNV